MGNNKAMNYIINTNGLSTYAVNGNTGNVDFSGSDAVKVIQSAINAVQSGSICIKEGVYYGIAQISTVANMEIIGIGKVIFDGIGIKINDADYVTISNVNFIGDPLYEMIYINNSSYVRITNCRANNIGIAGQSVFRINIPDNIVMSNIVFRDCSVTNGGRFGYWISANINTGAKLMDSMFVNCQAIGCGKLARNNDWVVGFDITETPNLENIQIIDCIANENWESGFHMESGAKCKNVYFVRCVANSNGQKPSAFFGDGFLLHDNIYLINCTASNNSGIVGQYKGCGASLSTCNDALISGCFFENNSGSSIRLSNTFKTSILNNNIHGGNRGIYDEGSSNMIIGDNVIANTVGMGIRVPSESIIHDNIITSSGADGIYIPSTSIRCNITSNYIYLSSGNGITADGAAYNDILNNIVWGSTGVAIACINPANNNKVCMNIVDKGISDSGINNKISLNKGFATENNVLSDSFFINSMGTKVVTIAHGLAIIPAVQNCSLTVVQDTDVDDWSYNMLKVVSTNATSVTVKINISASSIKVGATAKMTLKVGNP